MENLGYAAYSPYSKWRRWLELTKAVMEQYRAELPLTVRQIFYLLVALHDFPKTEDDYDKLAEKLALARRASILPEAERGTTPYIPFSWIRDDKMRTVDPFFYDGEEAFKDSMLSWAKQFVLDRQKGQSQVVEFWCEAAGMLPLVTRMAEPYSIKVSSSGGTDSVTTKHNLALRVAERASAGVNTLVCHVGDFDPTGENIYLNMLRDVREMVFQLSGSPDWFKLDRVALTAQQVEDENVITAPPKGKDKNLPAFLARHRDLIEVKGTTEIAAQLEALTPTRLRELLQEAIERHIDDSIVDQVKATEVEIRASLVSRVHAL